MQRSIFTPWLPKFAILYVLIFGDVGLLVANDLADFAAHPEYTSAKISPEGDYLAVGVRHEGKRALAVLDLQTKTPISLTGFYDKSEVGGYTWVNKDRLVLSIVRQRGALERPGSIGELYAVDANGKRGKYIFGYQAKTPIYAAGRILDYLDKKHILIETAPFGNVAGKDRLTEVFKLNVYSGKRKKIIRSNLRGANFILDSNKEPRLAIGVDDTSEQIMSYRNAGELSWQQFASPFVGDVIPVSFTDDDKALFLIAASSSDKTVKGLYRFNLESRDYLQIFHAGDTDVVLPFLSREGELYGLGVERHYPEFIAIDEKHELTRITKALVSSFEGANIFITSVTQDKSKLVFEVSAPDSPSTFYLFDRETKKATFLLKAYSRIDSSLLSSTEGFTIYSRDGLTLHGYITLPREETKNLPLVVMPHGGPHARDYWQYDPTVQALAANGYAVLQVNFRGSTGFGERFMEAGYGEWGRNIQHDIIDATKWAIAEGVADPERIAIFGASFGGYSALQAPIVAADLFRAAIGYVGVYDLFMLYNTGDIETIRWGSSYLNKTLGQDQQQLKLQSPALNADKLSDLPILIIHGKDDYRAAYEHAEVMRNALEVQGNRCEWLVKDNEEHGFYEESNRQELLRKVISFLNTNLAGAQNL